MKTNRLVTESTELGHRVHRAERISLCPLWAALRDLCVEKIGKATLP